MRFSRRATTSNRKPWKLNTCAFVGDHLGFVDHQPGDGIGFVIGQPPVDRAVQVADRHRPVHQIGAVVGALQMAFLRHHVEFVGDLAYDLFENILQRDQALQGAVFVDHQREMGAPLQEFAHLLVKRGGLGDEIGFHRHLGDIQRAQAQQRAVFAAHQPVDLSQQVLGMDHAQDVVVAVAKDRQAGVRAGQHLGQDLVRGLRGIDHLDLAAVAHDLVHRAVIQVQRTQ